MNFTIIQAYEGIAPAALAACLKPLRGRAVKRFESSQAKIKKLMDKDQDKAYEVEHQLLLSFPSQVEDILPTRLGNIIAAFEHYPYRRYGIDAITIWPRLQTVISNEQRKRIASAKSEFDFWINCSVLFLFAAIAFLLFLGKYGGGLTYWLTPAVCLLISTVSYQASLGFAVSWGETVKAAFDVHRFHLLKALGAKPVKGTLTAAEEQQIWRELQWSMKYRYLPDSKIVEFELPPDKKAESEKD